ncbi:MAG: DUF6544 family protein, partial [Bacteroidota bacterium]
MMAKIVFVFLVGVHALIHLAGFLKAFGLAELRELSQPISKTMGTLWLLGSLLFLLFAAMYLIKNSYWWGVGLLAVLVSQLLIIQSWPEAKYGTIVNVIVLLVAVVGFSEWSFERAFQRTAKENRIASRPALSVGSVTSQDLVHLPAPVKRYLQYAGVVGKPKIKNVGIRFNGQMRGREQDWFDFTSEQYNCFEKPSRLFFMKGVVKGLPTTAYHKYNVTTAFMKVKILSMLPVVDIEGDELFKTETVTYFNDLCLFAPAALIDKNIHWEQLDDQTAKATFTNQGISISAVLHFNEEGQLINFVSDDRKEINEHKYLRFSTPVRKYKNFNGYQLPSYGEAIWHYPEGTF